MIVVAIEHVYTNPDKDNIYGILNKTIVEHKKKYGDSLRKIEVKYNIEFF